MSKIYKTIIFLLLTVFMIYVRHPAFAQDKEFSSKMIRVSPVILSLTLSPGRTYHYEIKVENLLSSPLPVRLNLENFDTADEEGGYSFHPKTTSPFLSWITLGREDLIIPAKESRTIPLTITIPSQIPLGGYYGLIFVQPIFPKNAGVAEIASKVGVLLLGNIGVPDPSVQNGNISYFSTGGMLLEENPLKILFGVKNISLNFFSAKPSAVIHPLIGQTKKYEFEEKIILPDKIRRWEKIIDLKNYWYGIYNVELIVSTGEGRVITKNLYIVFFPFKKSAAILFIGFIIVFSWKRRGRLGEFFHILFSNERK